MRAITSLPLPAPSGTMVVIVREGQVSAAAGAGAIDNAANNIAAAHTSGRTNKVIITNSRAFLRRGP
jgi:hypothetical protein